MKVKCIKGLRIEGLLAFRRDKTYDAEFCNSNLGNIKIDDEHHVPIYFSTIDKDYIKRFEIITGQ